MSIDLKDCLKEELYKIIFKNAGKIVKHISAQ